MATFWERITAIFDSAERSSPSMPAVHELITRDAEELDDYAQWKRTAARTRLIDWLLDEYARFQASGTTEHALSFLDTPSSKGFVIHFAETNYTPREINHFFHYLRERILTLDYRTQISDRRIFSADKWVERQDRHYLKPRTRQQRMAGPPERGGLDQKFGNVTVELEYRDDLTLQPPPAGHYLSG